MAAAPSSSKRVYSICGEKYRESSYQRAETSPRSVEGPASRIAAKHELRYGGVRSAAATGILGQLGRLGEYLSKNNAVRGPVVRDAAVRVATACHEMRRIRGRLNGVCKAPVNGRHLSRKGKGVSRRERREQTQVDEKPGGCASMTQSSLRESPNESLT